MPLVPGSRLGPYEIVAPLGAGGMGEVYRARDTRLHRTVAIKVLPGGLAGTPDLRERLEREARAISAVEHAHICALYDLGADGGVDFLVMQFVEGETLAQRIRRGPIPRAEALELARQVALGLEAAHERGIVHRDLKPANIQVTPDGQVKILDFGLAKALSGEALPADVSSSPTATAGLTRPGVVVGSAPYMSPEQTRGAPVDKRTDVWAFGCVLFEMLSGHRAFDAQSSPEIVAAIVAGEPEWSRLPADTPSRIRDLIRRCLRKDPARRLRDVGDARLELEEVATGETTAAAAVSSPARSWSVIVPWSIAAASLVVAAGALLASRPTPAHRAPAMRFSAVTNVSGVEAQPSLSPDGRSVAYISNRGGQWDLYVGLVTGGSPVRITNDPNLETRPRWSRDGSRLLFARLNEGGRFDVWEAPALGGPARRVVLNGAHPTWSDDGRWLAYSSAGVLWISEVTGANPRAVTRPEPPIGHSQPAFSHDGRSVAFVRRREGPYGELAILDIATAAVRQVGPDRALAMSPAWSPDDKSIYFASSRGGAINVWKMPVTSGEPQQVTAGQGEDTDIDLSADGRRLVFSTFRINVNLAEMSLEPRSNGKLKWLTEDSARAESAPRYAPDGRRIAYFSTRSGAEREAIWVMDADGGNPSRIVGDDRLNIHPRWSSEGQHLFYVSRLPGLTMEGSELRRVPVAGGPPQALPVEGLWSGFWGDVAPDGRVLHRASLDAGQLYDPRTNQSRRIADVHGEVLWSRDGRSFAYPVRPDGRESDVGLWTGTLEGTRKLVFRGWVVSFAWTTAGELLVVEGSPDLKGTLWRVNGDGGRTRVLSGIALIVRAYQDTLTYFRFDVHPDGRRIVCEALEFLEADIGMIDNVF